jgi:hypothetical protein
MKKERHLDIAFRLATRKSIATILHRVNHEPELSGSAHDTCTRGELTQAIREKKIFLAYAGKAIVGIFWLTFYPTYAFMEIAFVERKARRLGVFAKFMAFSEALMRKRKVREIVCEVEAANTVMRKALRKHRWKTGDRFVFYSKEIA